MRNRSSDKLRRTRDPSPVRDRVHCHGDRCRKRQTGERRMENRECLTSQWMSLIEHYRPFFLYLRNTLSRFAGFDLRRRAQRSPTSRNRAGAVVIVKSFGSTPEWISSHVSGVETPAKSLARAL